MDRTMMNRTRATQLRLLAPKADDAIEQACAIAATRHGDHATLSASLDEKSLAMHTKLLLLLYLSHPGLVGEGQAWHRLRM
jgi:hypothetical protein